MTRRLTRWLAAAIVLLNAGSPSLARDAIVEGKSNWLFAGWESLSVAKPEAEMASVQLIAEINRVLSERGIKLIVAIVPLKPRYYETLLPEGMAISEPVRKRYDFLLSELRSQGVSAPDLRDAFKAVVLGKQEVFYRTDFHWTTFAAEASADQIAAEIISKSPLPGKAGSGTQLGDWMNDRHLGDLAANFLSPERKRAIGPDTYVIRTPPRNNQGLLDAEPAPVAVVGNSFVQPYFGFPQRLSNRIDRPVSLKWNPGDLGPWATLLQYLQSSEFKSNPVRFLVWQFNEAQLQNGPDAVGEWAAQGIVSAADWRLKTAEAIRNRK
ncbi:MAG: twin-arginine translocation pathway signal [Bradyrhizobium sp.]|uniref:alginate O-acetyltransferase AlgX-related protein n=1 Tax=Bradyrhizobium sp. TaxID=376 RepID=UPI0025C3CBF3|nr:twin-arginine translocation pathway signal [Bradyrhizobium sp.]MBI5261816.1 twin-arginine translocation pathway signal [Bradyrhizobium sp.]